MKAMRAALANIKALAKRSILERYKAKKAAPVEGSQEEEEQESPSEIRLEKEAGEEDAESPDEDGGDGEQPHDKTELIIMAHGRPRAKDANIAKAASEMLPVKRKPGRPKKQK
jgi:hypothetical protein